VHAERALEQGRGAYASGDWQDAFDALGRADREQPLAPEDLELVARSAYMLGLDDKYNRGTWKASFRTELRRRAVGGVSSLLAACA
jgi:hypothetical protein